MNEMQATTTDQERQATFGPGVATVVTVLSCGPLAFVLSFYLPRCQTVFEDFGLKLTAPSLFWIRLSNWATSYFYLVIPLGLGVLFASNAVAFSSIRTTLGRCLWVAGMAVFALLLAGGAFATMNWEMLRLHQQLS